MLADTLPYILIAYFVNNEHYITPIQHYYELHYGGFEPLENTKHLMNIERDMNI